MIVYADILIILNLLVDYFLLLATSKILHLRVKFRRMLLAAAEGGIFSLYIFLPQSPPFFEFSVRVAMCFLMSYTAFGFGSFRDFLKSGGIFFGITCLYAGSMTALWSIFKPHGMVINNSVVYFNISALTLIFCTVAAYFLFVFLTRIFAASSNPADRCYMELSVFGKTVEYQAIIDTGNSVTDVFGNSEIIISDSFVASELFGDLDINKNNNLKTRYRAIPLTTVSGTDMLDAFRLDEAVALKGEERLLLKSPILAVSKTRFPKETPLIVTPKIFINSGEENDIKNKKAYK